MGWWKGGGYRWKYRGRLGGLWNGMWSYSCWILRRSTIVSTSETQGRCAVSQQRLILHILKQQTRPCLRKTQLQQLPYGALHWQLEMEAWQRLIVLYNVTHAVNCVDLFENPAINLLLNRLLVAVAAIQSSCSTLEDVLTPRAYNTFKALYALAPLVTASSSTKPNRSEIPTRSTFSDMGNDYPNSSNGSPLLPNSSLGVPRTGRIHISITVEYVMFFSWAGLAVVACLVLVCLGYAKESPWSKRSFWRQGIYIYWLYIYLVLTCIIYQRFVVSFLLVWPPVCHISNVSTPSPASEDFFLVCFIYWLLVLFP